VFCSPSRGFNIIATANIRDRSVHEMSSALKRRFNFETVHPIDDLEQEAVDGGSKRRPPPATTLNRRQHCLRLFLHWARRAASRACCTAGRSTPISTALIATTTISSRMVKADRATRVCSILCLSSKAEWMEHDRSLELGHVRRREPPEPAAATAGLFHQSERSLDQPQTPTTRQLSSRVVVGLRRRKASDLLVEHTAAWATEFLPGHGADVSLFSTLLFRSWNLGICGDDAAHGQWQRNKRRANQLRIHVSPFS
jgi:hypothetical protein